MKAVVKYGKGKGLVEIREVPEVFRILAAHIRQCKRESDEVPRDERRATRPATAPEAPESPLDVPTVDA